MSNKRTVTTRETYRIDGTLKVLTRTHIATGAHGFEALCVSGSSVGENKTCVITAENQYPVNCPQCRAVWYDAQEFNESDFEPA